jgi:hypothetical protein
MNTDFRIVALTRETFAPLFAESDEALAARGSSAASWTRTAACRAA